MRKSGFTLVEMLAVLLILALLAAALTPGLSTARNKAWRAKARETCRQVCTGWNAYLLDARKFPSKIPGNGKALAAKYDNIKWITDANENRFSRIYLEITEKEEEEGLVDHWGQPIRFSLDMDYDNEVEIPYPNAFEPPLDKATATVVSWSEGDPKRKKRDDNPIIVFLGGTALQ